MAKNLNLNETVLAWAKIVLQIWDDKIIKYHAYDTKALANSLIFHVQTAANGNPDLISFFFNYYGKFVDMGVGKGVTLQEVSLGAGRKPKPWQSKAFYSQVMQLNKILAEKYAHKGAISIVENIDDNALRYGV